MVSHSIRKFSIKLERSSCICMRNECLPLSVPPEVQEKNLDYGLCPYDPLTKHTTNQGIKGQSSKTHSYPPTSTINDERPPWWQTAHTLMSDHPLMADHPYHDDRSSTDDRPPIPWWQSTHTLMTDHPYPDDTHTLMTEHPYPDDRPPIPWWQTIQWW